MKTSQRQPRRRYHCEVVDHTWLFFWLADAARYYAEIGEEEQQVYRIKIEGNCHIATALYIPGAKRLGIYSGWDMAWASNVEGIEAAIDDFVQSPETWGELPHIALPSAR